MKQAATEPRWTNFDRSHQDSSKSELAVCSVQLLWP